MASRRTRLKAQAAYAAIAQSERLETFGAIEWAPDVADDPAALRNLALATATGVWPERDGFQPAGSLNPLLVDGDQTTETIYSAVAFANPDGIDANAAIFGGSDKLYGFGASYTVTHEYASGSGNEVVPADATGVVITLYGPGGNGANGSNDTANDGGGGGGGGALCIETRSVQVGEIGTNIAYVVGSGGSGTASTASGTLGGGALSLSAGAGADASGTSAGAGGTASGGDTNTAGAAGAAGTNGATATTTTLTRTYNSGAGNETVPQGAISVTITCWGGGGGGGGGDSGPFSSFGGGGGGGGSGARCILASSVLLAEVGSALSYIVGSGGSAGAAGGTNGASGGMSALTGVIGGTPRTLQAGGGGGGAQGTADTPGAGGSAGSVSGGTTNTTGSDGSSGSGLSGGDGASAPGGGAGGSGGTGSSQTGKTGSAPGGGGGGGWEAQAGGPGAAGRITFEWVINTAPAAGGAGGAAASGGAGGAGGANYTAGVAGSAPGGGGGGGSSVTVGAAGAAGRVTFEWTIGEGGWVDLSRTSGGAYTTDPDEPWTWGRFGDLYLAHQINDPVQYFDPNSSTDFADLTSSDPPPPCRLGAIFGSQYVYMNIDGSGMSPALSVQEGCRTLIASEINDASSCPGDGTNSSWLLTLPDGGDITAGYEFDGGFWVAQAEMWRRVSFVGDAAVIDQNVAVPDAGVSIPGSFAVHNGRAFYISDSGFKSYIPGGLPEGIGENKVDEFFKNNYAEAATGSGRRLVKAAIDPVRKNYLCAVGFSGNTTLSHIFVCHFAHYPRVYWSLLDVSEDGVYTVLQTYLPRVGGGTDLTSWNRAPAAITGDGTESFVATFDGPNMAAEFETADYQWGGDQSCTVKKVVPLVDIEDPTDASVQVGYREHRGGDMTFFSAHTANSEGETFPEEYARFARLRTLIAEGAEWSRYRGLDVTWTAGGGR